MRSRVRDRDAPSPISRPNAGVDPGRSVFTYSVPFCNRRYRFETQRDCNFQLPSRLNFNCCTRTDSIARLYGEVAIFLYTRIYVRTWRRDVVLRGDNRCVGAIPAIFSINFQRRVFLLKNEIFLGHKNFINVHLSHKLFKFKKCKNKVK